MIMDTFRKIGLLVLNADQTKFLVCEPGERYMDKRVTQYLFPGGQLDEGESDAVCLERELREELQCDIDVESLKFIAEYEGPAATPDKRVNIRLYQGTLIGEPMPSAEIGAVHWIGKGGLDNPKVSAIGRNIIIPDLISRGILK